MPITNKKSSKKIELTLEERYALADAKEAAKELMQKRKQEQREQTAQKRIATQANRLSKLVQKYEKPAPKQKPAPKPLPAGKQDDPDKTDSDEDVQIISPAQPNPDEVDTDTEDERN